MDVAGGCDFGLNLAPIGFCNPRSHHASTKNRQAQARSAPPSRLMWRVNVGRAVPGRHHVCSRGGESASVGSPGMLLGPRARRFANRFLDEFLAGNIARALVERLGQAHLCRRRGTSWTTLSSFNATDLSIPAAQSSLTCLCPAPGLLASRINDLSRLGRDKDEKSMPSVCGHNPHRRSSFQLYLTGSPAADVHRQWATAKFPFQHRRRSADNSLPQ